jgi:hypothetical protein
VPGSPAVVLGYDVSLYEQQCHAVLGSAVGSDACRGLRQGLSPQLVLLAHTTAADQQV